MLVYNRRLTNSERMSMEAAISSKYGLAFPAAIPGLQAWLSVDTFQSLAAGSCITSWTSIGASGMNASLASTCPTASTGTLNGYKYAVFDTSDRMELPFDYYNQSEFTLSYLVRMPSGGSRKRALTAKNRNWLLGFHDGYAPRLYADSGGWLSRTTSQTYSWTLLTLLWSRTGTISFYQDGALVGSYSNAASSYGGPDTIGFNVFYTGETSNMELAGEYVIIYYLVKMSTIFVLPSL